MPKTKLIPVSIPELRMIVFVSAKKTIAQVRKKYLDQRDFNIQRLKVRFEKH